MAGDGDKIECPKCGEMIPLSETLQHQFTQDVKRELEAKWAGVLDKEKASAATREAEIRKKATEFVEQKKKEAEVAATEKAEAAISGKLQDLEEKNKEKDKSLADMRQAELDNLKKMRELEAAKDAAELAAMRKLETERKSIEEEATRKAGEESHLKALEKDKQINDMRKQIDDLKRKAEQGSQQTQGEVLELELESTLKAAFVYDEIVPVAKGITGADILQKVRDKNGREAGTIIWELKQTKAWSEGWITKLKEDQRTEKAEVAVIVSKTLPVGVKNFALVNGVWIANFECAVAVAGILRSGLIEVSTAKLSQVGVNEKMEVIYAYLCGTQFKQRVEAIVESFVAMKKDLDGEKRAMTKLWSTREKQIDRVISNTGGMYGDLQGLIGTSMPTIQALEFPALEEGSEEVEE